MKPARPEDIPLDGGAHRAGRDAASRRGHRTERGPARQSAEEACEAFMTQYGQTDVSGYFQQSARRAKIHGPSAAT